MSSKYAKVKKYYDNGSWSLLQVRNAVAKGWITREEFAEITGEEIAAGTGSTEE